MEGKSRNFIKVQNYVLVMLGLTSGRGGVSSYETPKLYLSTNGVTKLPGYMMSSILLKQDLQNF